MRKYGNFINGKDDYDGVGYKIVSPINGSSFAKAVKADENKVNEAIDVAFESREKWEKISLSHRKKIFARMVTIFEERLDDYASIEAENTGRTIRQSTFMDTNIALEHMRYFSTTKEFKYSRKIMHPEYPQSYGIVQNLPMGVVGAITPWNVPLLMAVWKIFPALLAGNTMVLKPSHYTPATTFELAHDLKRAGLPEGVLNIVNGDGILIGKTLAKSEKLRGLSFTGSTETGKIVTRNAAGTIKKIVMELGGKSPNIVLEDADLERAAKGVLFGIFLHSGQLCESGSRLLVQSSIKDKFLKVLASYAAKMKGGNPLDMNTDIGAITTYEQYGKIRGMVDRAINEGANIYYRKNLEGVVPEGGFYVGPTILDQVYPEMEIASEEVFGPVLSVMDFEKSEEAAEMANKSNYGLACGLWSRNVRKALRIANKINAGTVWINDYHLISAAAPRGGFGNSGIGRELGREGIYEFTESRHIFVSDEDNDILDLSFGLVVSD
ncbi:MAG: aldehyde dehydrogenase family protein [Cuniculiplasma sp.]